MLMLDAHEVPEFAFQTPVCPATQAALEDLTAILATFVGKPSPGTVGHRGTSEGRFCGRL